MQAFDKDSTGKKGKLKVSWTSIPSKKQKFLAHFMRILNSCVV